MTSRSGVYHNNAFIPLLPPAAAKTAAFTSASVDLRNYDAATVVANVGTSGDALSGTNRVELAVQESDDNATFTPVADADLLKTVSGQAAGTFANLNAPSAASQAYLTGYRGNKRYIRVAGTTYGTTSGGTFIDALAVLGRPKYGPVNS